MASNTQDSQPKSATGFDPAADARTSKSEGKPRSGAMSKPQKTKAPKKTHKTEKRMSRKERAAGTSIIPPVVSNRMLRRGLFFSGIPTALGFLVIPCSYFGLVNGWFELPNAAVLGGSFGGLFLGLLGITFSVLSASWDEARPGSLLGVDELKLNLSRIRESRQSSQRE